MICIYIYFGIGLTFSTLGLLLIILVHLLKISDEELSTTARNLNSPFTVSQLKHRAENISVWSLVMMAIFWPIYLIEGIKVVVNRKKKI